jgi:RimJ/RimL family protein N-acetyltransferase
MDPNNFIHLTTERLLLKPHTLSNLERLNAWFNDPELSYYDGDDPPHQLPETLDETRLTLNRMLHPPTLPLFYTMVSIRN